MATSGVTTTVLTPKHSQNVFVFFNVMKFEGEIVLGLQFFILCFQSLISFKPSSELECFRSRRSKSFSPHQQDSKWKSSYERNSRATGLYLFTYQICRKQSKPAKRSLTPTNSSRDTHYTFFIFFLNRWTYRNRPMSSLTPDLQNRCQCWCAYLYNDGTCNTAFLN